MLPCFREKEHINFSLGNEVVDIRGFIGDRAGIQMGDIKVEVAGKGRGHQFWKRTKIVMVYSLGSFCDTAVGAIMCPYVGI